jgi:hypothetical protein
VCLWFDDLRGAADAGITPIRRTAKKAANLREQTNERTVSGSDRDKTAVLLLKFG